MRILVSSGRHENADDLESVRAGFRECLTTSLIRRSVCGRALWTVRLAKRSSKWQSHDALRGSHSGLIANLPFAATRTDRMPRPHILGLVLGPSLKPSLTEPNSLVFPLRPELAKMQIKYRASHNTPRKQFGCARINRGMQWN